MEQKWEVRFCLKCNGCLCNFLAFHINKVDNFLIFHANAILLLSALEVCIQSHVSFWVIGESAVREGQGNSYGRKQCSGV